MTAQRKEVNMNINLDTSYAAGVAAATRYGLCDTKETPWVWSTRFYGDLPMRGEWSKGFAETLGL